jgi:DNA polymerase III delta prime subunit
MTIEFRENQFLWVERYRPTSVRALILPERIKKYMQDIVDSNEVPHILLGGSPGTGKTSSARAICNELNLDFLIINASENGNIDTLRTTIRSFASTVSFTSDYKVVILDEGDNLSCFAGEQKVFILSDGNVIVVPIEELDGKYFNLFSYDFEKKKAILTDGFAFCNGEKEVYEVEFEDGSIITCTEDHPFFDKDGNAMTIHDGELFSIFIELDGNKLMKIQSIKKIGVRKVYDISVNHPTHNFILENGVVAHNCATMSALRGFMEEFANNCRFIITCNYMNKIIDPIKSRCTCIEFNFNKDEKQKMMMEFDKRVKEILAIEKIEFEKKHLAQLIIKYFPDFRRILNELQRFTKSGELQADIVGSVSNDSISELYRLLSDPKKWGEVRKWVAQHSDDDPNLIFRSLYERSNDFMKPSAIPQLVLHLANYGYKNAFVADPEINLVACLTEIMSDCEFL